MLVSNKIEITDVTEYSFKQWIRVYGLNNFTFLEEIRRDMLQYAIGTKISIHPRVKISKYRYFVSIQRYKNID